VENQLEKQYKAGLFVALGVLLVIGSLFLLGGERAFLTKKVFLHAHFPNVQGLNVGSVVSLSGVNVGNITKIDFIKQQSTLDLELQVDASFLPRVTQGSTVEIRTQGALGDKYVYIIPGAPDAPALQEGAVLEPNKTTDLLDVISERSGEAAKIFDIISDIHKIIRPLADGNRADKILSNLAEASVLANKTSKESQQLIADFHSQSSPKIKSALEKLDRILTKIDQGEGTLGALINDSSIHDQVKAMVGGSSRKKNIKNLLRGSIEKGGSEEGQ
jgi:phospholipid/cholesterol/gamma-HCH transport system substrate-binding protein